MVAADLRGYGGSSTPPDGENHEAYSKRAMARDMVRLMERLGHERFAVAGHDRGGRVAHRMARDHPERVARAALLDIVPTATLRDGRPGRRDLLLPLVLPDPAGRAARDDDRARPRVVPARDRAPLVGDGHAGGRGRDPRVRALVLAARGDPRHLRGLPRRRVDRPRARRRGRGPAGVVPAARALGRGGADGPHLRRAGDLAGRRRRRARAGDARRPLRPRGGAAGDHRRADGAFFGEGGGFAGDGRVALVTGGARDRLSGRFGVTERAGDPLSTCSASLPTPGRNPDDIA